MKVIFLSLYTFFICLMIGAVYKLVAHRHTKEAIIGLFMAFTIVPDIVILDVFDIPGTFVIVFFFICLLPFFGLFIARAIKIRIDDSLFVSMLVAILIYALYTKFVKGNTTEYYGKKLFEYIYTLLIPMIVVIHYKEAIIRSYDLWKTVLMYAIMAYAFKNFFMAGILGFRDTYILNCLEFKNVIFAAQVLAIGAIMCIYDLIRRYEAKKLLFFGVLLLQILLFESRGPILSLAVAGFIIWWVKSGKHKIIWRVNLKAIFGFTVFAMIVAIGFSMLWNRGYLERIVEKLNMLASGDRNEIRYYLYPATIQAIKAHFPWGIGFGNSRIALTRINKLLQNDYPHNLLLELLLEEGVLFCIPLFIMLFKAFKSIGVKNKYSNHTLLFYALFIFAFICSQFSGDISGNRYVFIFGYLAYCSQKMARKEGAINQCSLSRQLIGGYNI